MGEVIRFVRKSERERARLFGEARAIYDSIFPPADRASERQDSGADADRSSGVLLWLRLSLTRPVKDPAMIAP
jgi:hypothetical protein